MADSLNSITISINFWLIHLILNARKQCKNAINALITIIPLTQLSQVQNCLEGNTISNPVHTSVTRMCGDYDIPFYILPGGQYIVEVA